MLHLRIFLFWLFKPSLICISFILLEGCIKAPSPKKITIEEEEIRLEEVIPTCETGAVESSWNPNIQSTQGLSAGSTRRDLSVSIVNETQEARLQLTGLDQSFDLTDSTRVASFQITVPTDLGPYGALSMLGTVSQIPKTLVGDAFSFLVSFHDGTKDWVKLKPACFTEGLFNCSGGTCSVNSNCDVDVGSAYASRREWEQSQRPSFGAASFVSFPHCLAENAGSPQCLFGSSLLGPGRSIPFGITYTAKYVVISDSYSSLSGKHANLKIEVNKKSDFVGPTDVVAGSNSGSVDVNVFLVGSAVVQAGQSATGKKNLDALFSRVMDTFGQSSTRLALGEVKAYDLDCTLGEVNAIASLDDLGLLIKGATQLLPSDRDQKSVNVFLVSQILDSDPNFSILGVSGALRGPLRNGLHSSGLVVSTFDQLGTQKSGGPGACPNQCAESSFVRLSNTVAHEIGHFLGLNHLSERSGSLHDSVSDTPLCTATDFIAGGNYLTNFSCKSDLNAFTDYDITPNATTTCQASCGNYNGVTTFCSTAKACQFNHLMWWTTSNYNASSGQGDGTLLSSESGKIINAHPLVQ